MPVPLLMSSRAKWELHYKSTPFAGPLPPPAPCKRFLFGLFQLNRMCDPRTGAGHRGPGHIAGHMAHLLLNHGIAMDTRTLPGEGAVHLSSTFEQPVRIFIVIALGESEISPPGLWRRGAPS